MPGDAWAQYAEPASPAAGSDPWAQYVEKPSADGPLPPPMLSVGAPPSRPAAAASMHPSFLIGDPNADATPQSIGDVARGMGKNLYQVSAPGVAASLAHHFAPGALSQVPVVGPAMERNAAPLDRVPMQAGENFALMALPGAEGESGEVAAGEGARPTPVAPVGPRSPASAPDSPPGVLGRAGEVAWRRAGKIPGVQAIKDADYILRGPKVAPAAPETPEIPIPETNGIPWGSGGQGPIDLRGQYLPPTYPGAPLPEHPGVFPGAPEPEIPASVRQGVGLRMGGRPVEDPAQGLSEIPVRAAGEGARPTPQSQVGVPGEDLMQSMRRSLEGPPTTRRAVGEELDRALGNEPVRIRPGVKMRDQFRPQSDVQPGHTAVESSAVHSYKYDAGARQFEVQPKDSKGGGGQTTYVYGDVSPDDAAAFEKAKSKGTAWKEIRRVGTPVAKIVNGERIPLKGGLLRSPQGATIPKAKAGMNPSFMEQVEESLRKAGGK